MAKFINKKEQVYDLKLTSYGHHLLSIGEFSPTYYAFFDDNVIYDINYTFVPTRDTYDLAKPWSDNCSVYDAAPGPLQGWWRLNTDISVAGDAVDSSGKNRPGNDQNERDYVEPTYHTNLFTRPTFSTTLYPPDDSSSLVQVGSCTFNGQLANAGNAVNIGTAETWDAIIGNDTEGGSTQQMSFAFWVYKTGDGSGTTGRLIDFGNGDIKLYTTSADILYFGVKWTDTGGTGENDPAYWNTDAAVVPDPTGTPAWTHIVVTYDATLAVNNPKMYVNGAAVAITEATAPAGEYYGIVSQDAFIGNEEGGSRPFQGQLADVAIWNKILTAEEVSLIYNASQGAATACSAWTENQNQVDNRIKNETQYLESLVLFEDIDDAAAGNIGSNIDPLSTELTWVQRLPRKDVFKMDAMIGDAYLDGKTNAAPAWKVVSLQSTINSSQEKGLVEEASEIAVPQLNIEANYIKKVVESTFEFDPSSVRTLNDQTSAFIDDKIIILEQDDPVLYVEEINTELLTENFEIEVFGYVVSGSNARGPATGSQADTFERKFFRKDIPQIVDGFLVSQFKETVAVEEITTGSVEYYFDVLVDQSIDQSLACRGATAFNKSSYYIDLDFDCDEEKDESVFYDIYGSVTEPEICQD